MPPAWSRCPLLLLILPVLGFATGAPGIDELPSSNPARQSAETIDRAVGPGWEAPFVLVAATDRGPITTRRDLAAAEPLAAADRRRARECATVIGPAPVARRTAPLRSLGDRLTADGAGRPGRRSRSWGRGCAALPTRSASCARGLDEGAAGSGLLAEGSERAAAGAGLIAPELKTRRRPRRRSDRGDRPAGGRQQAAGQGPARSLGRHA